MAITLEVLERFFELASPLVSQVWCKVVRVVPTEDPVVVAVATVAPEPFYTWAKNEGMHFGRGLDIKRLIMRDSAKTQVLEDFHHAANVYAVPWRYHIEAVHLVDEPFSTEFSTHNNNQLKLALQTPTYQLCRPNLEKVFKENINQMQAKLQSEKLQA